MGRVTSPPQRLPESDGRPHSNGLNSLLPSYLLGALGSGAYIYLRRKACGLLITARNRALKFCYALSLHKVDRAPAKSSARHARPVNTFDLRGQFDHYVKLPAAYLVVVAQTPVRISHKPSKIGQIAAFQRRRRFDHTG